MFQAFCHAERSRSGFEEFQGFQEFQDLCHAERSRSGFEEFGEFEDFEACLLPLPSSKH
jgi:hypothetical protein